MIAFLSWYIAITLFGWLAWPLLFRLAPGLPDRGYTISRALGLMLTGYLFWLLGSFGFLQNTIGGMLFCALIVLSVGLWAYFTRPNPEISLRSWVAANRTFLFSAELLFLVGFTGWTVFRAFNPEIINTEKPMELMFLNGVRTSAVFPPRDSWLSGYAISYYYFGYILMAMLADLTGVASEIAFNLGVALLFGLTILGSYGLIYNLVTARRGDASGGVMVSALLGPIFVAIMGNLEGFFELLYGLGLPKKPFLGITPEKFWAFIDLRDLDTPATQVGWPLPRWSGMVNWPWWRASRVIRDKFPIANALADHEPIDEFPMFSFLLGDMHPHVLALPFVLLALGLALNVLLQKDRLNRVQLVLYTLVFGALAFLNTWDLPIYLFILVAALVIREIRERGEVVLVDLVRPILTGIGIFVAGIIAYLPWYISFSSQAGGVLPNAMFPTRLHQLLIMFGPFIFIIVWFLVDRAVRHYRHMNWGMAAPLGIGLLLLLFLGMMLMGLTAMRVDPGVRNSVATMVDPSLVGQPDELIVERMPSVITTLLTYRLTKPLTALLLTLIIVLCLAAMLPRMVMPDVDEVGEPSIPIKANINPSNAFVLLLILTAALLTIGPEFIYLRDVFGTRLNTIFKFYYAGWLLFALGAAYAAHEILSRPSPAYRVVFGIPLIALIAGGLIYPALAVPYKASNFEVSETPPTLDGIDYIKRGYSGDYEGIEWLRTNADPGSVIIEAVGGPYSYHGRVSMATGLPAVMGWPGHERQWRGPLYDQLAGSREQDVTEIYNTPNMRRAQELLEFYGVQYVFVGSLEQSSASPAGISKFDRFLAVAFRGNNVVIYRADRPLVEDIP